MRYHPAIYIQTRTFKAPRSSLVCFLAHKMPGYGAQQRTVCCAFGMCPRSTYYHCAAAISVTDYCDQAKSLAIPCVTHGSLRARTLSEASSHYGLSMASPCYFSGGYGSATDRTVKSHLLRYSGLCAFLCSPSASFLKTGRCTS